MFPAPVRQPPPPNGMSPKNPALPAATYYVRLPTTCYSLLPIYYLLPITTYYYLLPTTDYNLPHTTPPHRGRGDWTMLLLLGYHDHGWDPEPGTYIYIHISIYLSIYLSIYVYNYKNILVDSYFVGDKSICSCGSGLMALGSKSMTSHPTDCHQTGKNSAAISPYSKITRYTSRQMFHQLTI